MVNHDSPPPPTPPFPSTKGPPDLVTTCRTVDATAQLCSHYCVCVCVCDETKRGMVYSPSEESAWVDVSRNVCTSDSIIAYHHNKQHWRADTEKAHHTCDMVMRC